MDKLWLTEYRVFDGKISYIYSGPRIKAKSMEEAQQIADSNEFVNIFDGKLKVIGCLEVEFEEINLN